jgi:thiol:disulfide interchange protein DsbA
MKTLLSILLISTLTLATSACSEDNSTATNQQPSAAAAYRSGVHYISIAEPFAPTGTQNVVTEFFWYGCPHCENFEPVLKKWQANKPFNTILKKSPAIWNEPMKLHAKLFYIAETMNIKAAAIHAELFRVVTALRSETDLAKQQAAYATVFAKHGMDTATFEQQLKSPKIEAQVTQAEKLMKQGEIRSTPTVIVNGKYQIQNKATKSPTEVMQIANFLIEQGE